MTSAERESLHNKMGEIRELLWDRDAAARDYREVRREPIERKQMLRAQARAKIRGLDAAIETECAALRDMLNAVLGDSEGGDTDATRV